jgi:hypothetical protein
MELQSNKTARLTVLLAPEDKQRIEQRARKLDLSVGEYVRRASQSYEPELDSATLDALVEEWRSNVAEMRAKLADALTYSERRLSEARALREARHGDR